MNKKIYLIMILILALTLAACAKKQVVIPNFQNKRIIKRDLTKPKLVFHKISPILEIKPVLKKEKKPQERVLEKKAIPQEIESKKEATGILPHAYVEFQNESSRLYDKSVLQEFMAKGNKDAHLFLVGHSHGTSSVGTLNLASQRAKTIKDVLNNQGFKKVYLMAAWSQAANDFTPTRGVHLYSVNNISTAKGIPLVFLSNEVKNDNSKINRKNSVVPNKIAANNAENSI